MYASGNISIRRNNAQFASVGLCEEERERVRYLYRYYGEILEFMAKVTPVDGHQ